jgi:hypothetical protein
MDISSHRVKSSILGKWKNGKYKENVIVDGLRFSWNLVGILFRALGCLELKKKYKKNPSLWALDFLSIELWVAAGEIWQKSLFFFYNLIFYNLNSFCFCMNWINIIQNKIFRWKTIFLVSLISRTEVTFRG